MAKILLMLLALVALPNVALGQSHPNAALDVALKRIELAKRKFGHEQLNAFAEALAALDDVVARFPSARSVKSRALLEKGRLMRKLGDHSGAEAAWQSAAEIVTEARGATDALLELASMHRRNRKVLEAQNALETIIGKFASESRNHAEALLRLASLHRSEKRPDACEATLMKCLAEHLDLRTVALDALDRLVALKLDQGQGVEAANVFRRIAEELKLRFREGRDASRVALQLDLIRVRLKSLAPSEGRL